MSFYMLHLETDGSNRGIRVRLCREAQQIYAVIRALKEHLYTRCAARKAVSQLE